MAHRAHINLMQYSDSLIFKPSQRAFLNDHCRGEKAGPISILARSVLADILLLPGDVRSISIEDQ